MNIGRMIFYDLITGEVIIDTGEWANVIKKKTIDEQVAAYKALSERNQDTFDVIELEYGQFAQDFAEARGFRINPETKELEFSYPNPNQPDEPQPSQRPLTEQIKEIRVENAQANAELFEMVMQMGGM